MKNKEKIRPVVSKIDPVPSYRAYGVTKREGFFARLNDVIATVYIIAFFLFCMLFIAIGLLFMIALLGNTGIAIVILCCLSFVYFKLLRTLRKRIRFILKLRKVCKRLGYRVEFKRGFFKGMRLNTEGFDFFVDTPQKRWCVRFMTVKKYRSHLVFLDADNVEVKSNITTNHIKHMLGWDMPKVKKLKYSFNDSAYSGYKKTEKALVLNPVPYGIFFKDADGKIVQTGSGQEFCDYRIFSGSGFINTIQRKE